MLCSKSQGVWEIHTFLKKQGLDKFRYVIPLYFASIFKSELILEQYFLLDPSFNLNVSRVVNVPAFVSNTLLYFVMNLLKIFD